MPLGYQTGLRVWLEARTITGLSNGDPLSDGDWVDQSPNAFSTTVVETPLYQDGVADGPNGQPYVQVGRSAHGRGKVRLPTNYNDGLTGTNGCEIFMVLRRSTGPVVAFEEHGPFDTFGGGSGNNYPSGSGTVNLNFASNATKFSGLASSLTQDIFDWHVLNMRSKTNLWQATIGGEIVADLSSNTFSIIDRTTGDQSDLSSNVGCFKGAIAAVLIFDHIPSTINRQTILDYLSVEFGTGSLVASEISGVALSQSENELTIVPAGGATDHSIYGSLDPAFVAGPSNLLFSSLGAAPAPQTHSGLSAGEVWYYLVRNTDGVDTRDSAKISVTTDGPLLYVAAITDQTVTLGISNPDTDWLEVHYQTALTADTAFASPVDIYFDSTTARFSRTVAGLLTATGYRSRVRVRTIAGWQSFTGAISYTTLSSPFIVLPGLAFTDPDFGEPVSGAAVTISITPPTGLTWVSTEISDDKGVTWSPLTTVGSGNTRTFDSTGFADSWYLLRFTFDDASTLVHPGFRIDNAATVALWKPSFIPSDLGDYGEFWSNENWAAARASFGCIGGQAGYSVLAPTGLSPAIADEARVSTTGAIYTDSAGSQPGGEFWASEHAELGVAALVRGTTIGSIIGVRAYLRTTQMSHAYPPHDCQTAGVTTGGSFLVEIIDVAAGVVHRFIQSDIVILASWDQLQIRLGGPFCLGRMKKYYFVFEVTKPDRINFPNRLRVVAQVHGTQTSILVDQTVDVVDTSNDPVTPDCGYSGMLSNHAGNTFSGADFGWRQFFNFGLDYIETSFCNPPPPGLLPDELIIDAVVVCDDVTLTVSLFQAADPNVVSARWEITDVSDPTFANPVVDTGFQATDIDSYLAEDLLPGDYIARLTYTLQDSSVVVSDVVTFTIEANTPPTAPAWVQPSMGEVFVGVSTIDLQFTAAFDYDGDPLQYEIRYSLDGITLIPLFALGTVVPGNIYQWDISGLPSRTAALYVRACDPCECGPWAIVCIEIEPPPCPIEEINVTTVRRLEVFSDNLGNGGARQAFIPHWLDNGVRDHRSVGAPGVGGEETCTIEIPYSDPNFASHAFNYLDAKKVIRTVWQDFTWDEWRIAQIEDRLTDDNARVMVIECEAIYYDLGSTIAERVELNGLVLEEFGLYGLTPEEHIQAILRHAKPYFIAGHADNAIPVDVDYDWDTPLAALLQLSERSGLELDIRRICGGKYIVRLLDQVGAEFLDPIADIDATVDVGDPFAYTFSAAGTQTPSGAPILTYSWLIDGVTAYTGVSINHDFSTAGHHTVQVTVADQNGLTDVHLLDVYVAESGASAEEIGVYNGGPYNYPQYA